uniref:Pleckstrin homology domain containing A1 n=1 Tax=Nothobranchius furzeri TaxID=105023 RepID=A0A8C6KUH4_NOTFU
MPYVDRQNRICGFLDIEENENSGKFLRRYFILDTEQGNLLWFMDNPQLSVFLPRRSDLSLVWCLSAVINAGMRKIYLQANDQQDLVDWISVLNNATKITVPKPGEGHNTYVETPQDVPGAIKQVSYKTEIIGGVPIITATQEQPEGQDALDRGKRAQGNFLSRGATDQSFIKAGYCVKQGALVSEKYFSCNIISIFKSCVSHFWKNLHANICLFFVQFKGWPLDGSSVQWMNCLSADSPEDMHSWIKAISGAIVAQRGPGRSANTVCMHTGGGVQQL